MASTTEIVAITDGKQPSSFWNDLKKGSLQPVWLAAFYKKKLNKRIVLQCHLEQSCTDIRRQVAENNISLRWIAALLQGACIIYGKQMDYLVQDSDDFNNRLAYAFDEDQGFHRRRNIPKLPEDKPLEPVINIDEYDADELLNIPHLDPTRYTADREQLLLHDDPTRMEFVNPEENFNDLEPIAPSTVAEDFPFQQHIPIIQDSGFEKLIGATFDEGVVTTSHFKTINNIQEQPLYPDLLVNHNSPGESYIENTNKLLNIGISPDPMLALQPPRLSRGSFQSNGYIPWDTPDNYLLTSPEINLPHTHKRKQKKQTWDEEILIPSKLMKIWWDNPLEPPKLQFPSSYWTWPIEKSNSTHKENEQNIKKLTHLPYLFESSNKRLTTLEKALNDALTHPQTQTSPLNNEPQPTDHNFRFPRSEAQPSQPVSPKLLPATERPNITNITDYQPSITNITDYQPSPVYSPWRRKSPQKALPSQSNDGSNSLLSDSNKLSKSCVELIHRLRNQMSITGYTQPSKQVLFSEISDVSNSTKLSRCLYNLLILEMRGYITTEQSYGVNDITIIPQERIWDEQFTGTEIYSQILSPLLEQHERLVDASIPSDTPFHRRMTFI